MARPQLSGTMRSVMKARSRHMKTQYRLQDRQYRAIQEEIARMSMILLRHQSMAWWWARRGPGYEDSSKRPPSKIIRFGGRLECY